MRQECRETGRETETPGGSGVYVRETDGWALEREGAETNKNGTEEQEFRHTLSLHFYEPLIAQIKLLPLHISRDSVSVIACSTIIDIVITV